MHVYMYRRERERERERQRERDCGGGNVKQTALGAAGSPLQPSTRTRSPRGSMRVRMIETNRGERDR